MDTSKEYIDMCSKAKEIQELWDPKRSKPLDDMVYVEYIWNPIGNRSRKQKEVSTACGHSKEDLSISCVTGFDDVLKVIWLPRQDQLQGMLKKINKTSLDPLLIETSFIKNNMMLRWKLKKGPTYNSFEVHGKSYEQLWLKSLMGLNFGKRWNLDKKNKYNWLDISTIDLKSPNIRKKHNGDYGLNEN